ncbi:dehydration-responsive element-binding protein 1H-like [Lolium perenne]|uniref:dehydration-responsive element-binding protein 1H-like n=1 Tax=Lolium perenne TaxID=4522 RepID=UPI0021EA260D|nr:dehydration-responsive element-binding protein 1H-like [Lolium perenne]
MDTGNEYSLTPASSSSSQELGMPLSPTSPTPKRPAGRTKFKETRHPVYRGVRRRGSNGRWVCEVRVPSRRGERLWLGTHVTAEAAARAHDAAMLAMHGPSSAACLNFPDSAWMLDVPSNLSDLAEVRRAAIEAVVKFLRQEATKTGGAAVAVPVDGVASAALAPSPYADNAGSSATSQPSAASEVSAALGSDMLELHVSGEMGLGTYYADLAEGLLLEPPPPAATSEHGGDGGGHDASLWKWNH